MIRASASTQGLIQRLTEQAAQIAVSFAAARSSKPRSRRDWYSASALWPDLFEEKRSGK